VRPDLGNRASGNRGVGNAAQMLEKYKTLARDATQAGDRITAEYYFQYADHYFRVLNENRPRFEDRQPQQRRDWQEQSGERSGDYDRGQRNFAAGEDEAGAPEGYAGERDEPPGDGERGYVQNRPAENRQADRGQRANIRGEGDRGARDEAQGDRGGYRRDGRRDRPVEVGGDGRDARPRDGLSDQRYQRDQPTKVGGDGRDARPRADQREGRSDQRGVEPRADGEQRRDQRPGRERWGADDARDDRGSQANPDPLAREPVVAEPPTREAVVERDVPAPRVMDVEPVASEPPRPKRGRPRKEDVAARQEANDDPFAVRRAPEPARAIEEPIKAVEGAPAEAEAVPKRRGRRPKADPGNDAELSLENA